MIFLYNLNLYKLLELILSNIAFELFSFLFLLFKIK